MGEEDKLSFDRASQATTQGDMLQSEDVKEDQPPMLGTYVYTRSELCNIYIYIYIIYIHRN